MDTLISLFGEWFDKGKYSKITEISYLIFNLIAPVFCFIFLYKRDLFYKIDIGKLLILCIILNSILIFIVYTFVFMCNNLKNEIRPETEKLDRLELKDLVILKTQIIVFLIAVFIIGSYVYNIIIRGNVTIYDNMMYTLCGIILIFLYYSGIMLIYSLKLKRLIDILFNIFWCVSFINLIYKIIIN